MLSLVIVCAKYQEQNDWHTLHTSQTIYDRFIEFEREDETCSATYWQACPDAAVACHSLFFRQDEKDKILTSKPLKTDSIIRITERFSINFLGGVGKICRPYFEGFIRSQDDFFTKFDGEERADADEPYLSYEHLVENNKSNFICMNFLVSHFAFGKQRDKHMVPEFMDEGVYIDDDYRFVERYQALALKIHKNCGLPSEDRKPLHVLIKETNREDEKLLHRQSKEGGQKERKRSFIDTEISNDNPRKSSKKSGLKYQSSPLISPNKVNSGHNIKIRNNIQSQRYGKPFVVRNKKAKYSIGDRVFVSFDIPGYKPGTTFYQALLTKCEYSRKIRSFVYDITWIDDNTYGMNIDESRIMSPSEYKAYVMSQSTWKHRNNDKAGNPVNLIQDGEEDFDLHDDFCNICGDGGKLLCCDTCTLAYHLRCARVRKHPTEMWSCPVCVDESI